MKSLNRILVLYKVFKIIWLIAFALCIAGVAGIAIGMTVLGVVKDTIIVEGKTLVQFLDEKGTSVNKVFVGMSLAMLWCAAGIFLNIYLARFTKEVIDEGTPFTRPLLKKMRVVAIVHMAVSVGTTALCGVGLAIAAAFEKALGNVPSYGFYSIGFGLILLVISLFLEYPIELQEKENKSEVLPEPEVLDTKVDE